MHPFFGTIHSKPILEKYCRVDLINLPEAYSGQKQVKAILLGADPTNNGIKSNKGQKELSFVFGINSEYEQFFFGPQQINLRSLGLDKDNLFIQNVCRNYFTEETSKNKHWKEIAKIWLPFLKEELSTFPSKLPILVTAEKIMEVLIPDTPRAEEIYSMVMKPYFYSVDLKREVYPLYRHPKYMLSNRWYDYREFLIRRINE